MDNKPDDGQNTPSDPMPINPQETFIVNQKHALRRALGLNETDDLSPNHREIIFLVRGMTERVPMKEGLSIVLGRSDLKSGFTPDVDLTAYGGQKRGVSRSHVRVHIDKDQVYVTDLGGPNGTFIGEERLTANQPRLIKSGEHVYLGSLPIQIVF